jgi:drug/metabolite transporter (DMT)-like permease
VSTEGRGRVLGVLVFVQVVFAVHYLLAKVLLAYIPPPAWASLRILAAASIFAVLYTFAPRRAVAGRDVLALAGFAFFGVVLNQLCFVEGLSRTTPAHSSLINTTIPIATVTFAVLLGKERLTRPTVIGIALALAGVLTLLRVDHLELRSEWFWGDLLTQLNAASFALFLVISKSTITRVGSLPATAILLAFGSLGVAIYGGVDLARLDFASVPPRIWWIGAWIVVFPTALAYFLNNWALRRVRSSVVALFIYLQPILASVLSVTLLHEPVTVRLVVSSVLIFLGVLFATQGSARKPATTAPVALTLPRTEAGSP